jgi:predicted HTH transcriptional regulator
MIPTVLNLITAENIQSLVDNAVEEGVTLDFKRDLPGDDRDSRKEFVADVCAMANTKGGDLVYGVDEEDGAASKWYRYASRRNRGRAG